MSKGMKDILRNESNNNSKSKVALERKVVALYIVLILSIICLILSVVIQIEKGYHTDNTPTMCSAITGANGCQIVQTSKYSSTFGIDNPIYGMIGFTLMIILTILSIYSIKSTSKLVKFEYIKYMLLFGGIMASIIAVWFLYIQAFILHKYCIFCVIVDILSLIMLILLIYIFLNKKRN
jgi:uncharacterized membrane protein